MPPTEFETRVLLGTGAHFVSPADEGSARRRRTNLSGRAGKTSMGRALAAIMHVPVARGVLHLSLLTCSFLAINSAAAKDCGAPKSIRPLEGLIAESNVRQGDASIISDISSKRVAIVVSSNAEKQLAWNESLRQPPTGIYRLTLDLSGRLVQWEQASRDTYDPKAIVAGMVAPFVSVAKQVKAMADLVEFRDSGFELAVVLDLNFRCSYEMDWWSGATDSDSEIEIVAYPLNPNLVMGPTVHGRSKLRARYQPGHAEVDRSREDSVSLRLAAANDFRTNVERAYAGNKVLPQSDRDNALPTGASNHESMQARLQAVEDLRKRGLISEREAEAKRKDILLGL
jgi:hypothetical protein